METFRNETGVRLRVAHSFTQAGGWRYESTAEVMGNSIEEVKERTRLALEAARELGEAERDARNGRSGL